MELSDIYASLLPSVGRKFSSRHVNGFYRDDREKEDCVIQLNASQMFDSFFQIMTLMDPLLSRFYQLNAVILARVFVNRYTLLRTFSVHECESLTVLTAISSLR